MQQLNYLSMLTAVRDCTETDGFRVGIFTNRLSYAKEVFSELMESMDEEEREAQSRAVKSFNSNFIEFKNGSYIKVLSASENARGNAFHKVLYQDGIDRDILYCVVKHTEKLQPRMKGDGVL